MFGVEKLKDSLTNFVNYAWWEGKEIIDPKKAEQIDKKYAAERQGLLSEVAESAVDRIVPFWSKLIDVGKSVVGKKHTEERVGQNEFESITAWSMFVPNFLLKHVTNVIAKNKVFESLVKNYPLAFKNKTRLLDENGQLKTEPDPDYVINFLRMVHQDIISGKVAINKVSGTGQYKAENQTPTQEKNQEVAQAA